MAGFVICYNLYDLESYIEDRTIMFHSQEVQSQQSILPSDLTDQSKNNKIENLTKQKSKVPSTPRRLAAKDFKQEK